MPENEVGTGLTFKEAIKGYRFWILLVSIFVVYIAMSGMVPNLIPALIDQGISAQLAATAISVFGVTVILGRLIVGYLVDIAWAPGVAAFAISLPVIGSLLLAGSPPFLQPALRPDCLVCCGSRARPNVIFGKVFWFAQLFSDLCSPLCSTCIGKRIGSHVIR